MQTLTTKTTDELFDLLTDALYGTALGTALAIANEMCRPERKGTCYDLLSPNAAWPLFTCGYTTEQLQGLRDRMAQFNLYVEVAWIERAQKQAREEDARANA